MQLNEEWFRRRGWQLNKDVPGQGQAIHDLVLDFANWRYVPDESAQTLPQFRLCMQEDMVRVLEMVEQVSIRQAKMGWFDQYSSLMNGPNVKDIVLGIENDMIIAAALTYTPSCGSQIASNLPWASRIGHDVGGLTCICISRKFSLKAFYEPLSALYFRSFNSVDINAFYCSGLDFVS
jgi:hypothetical protein